MKLYHVSEESDIKIFEPRLPTRKDLPPNIGLVWAIDEKRLPNFLTPRNCPRVTYHLNENTTQEDKEAFFTSKTCNHAVIIESDWYERMRNTTLYLYEFDPADFYLQDAIAGYYTSEKTQTPIGKTVLTNLFDELIKRNVEIRMVGNLWDITEKVKKSTLNYSLCRMGYAKPRVLPNVNNTTIENKIT